MDFHLLRDLGTLLYHIQGQLSDFCVLEIAGVIEFSCKMPAFGYLIQSVKTHLKQTNPRYLGTCLPKLGLSLHREPQ